MKFYEILWNYDKPLCNDDIQIEIMRYPVLRANSKCHQKKGGARRRGWGCQVWHRMWSISFFSFLMKHTNWHTSFSNNRWNCDIDIHKSGTQTKLELHAQTPARNHRINSFQFQLLKIFKNFVIMGCSSILELNHSANESYVIKYAVLIKERFSETDFC